MSNIIAAISTGRQVCAIGIIRMSGEGCIAVAEKVFTPQVTPLSQVPSRKLVMGSLRDSQGRVIDHCMAVCSRAPHSYTAPLPCWRRDWMRFIVPAPGLPKEANLPSGHF